VFRKDLHDTDKCGRAFSFQADEGLQAYVGLRANISLPLRNQFRFRFPPSFPTNEIHGYCPKI